MSLILRPGRLLSLLSVLLSCSEKKCGHSEGQGGGGSQSHVSRRSAVELSALGVADNVDSREVGGDVVAGDDAWLVEAGIAFSLLVSEGQVHLALPVVCFVTRAQSALGVIEILEVEVCGVGVCVHALVADGQLVGATINQFGGSGRCVCSFLVAGQVCVFPGTLESCEVGGGESVEHH